MVKCPKQQQNANWNQVEIENLIVRARNLPRTNSTKTDIKNIFAKKHQNEHTPLQIQMLTYFFQINVYYVYYLMII